jgi:hypothetical protein
MPQLHLAFWPLFFWLMVGHCLADYPLQGDFLAQFKNHTHKLGEKYWAYGLVSHGLIHAGFVAFLTGHVSLGLAELVAHIGIDRAKCSGKITFHEDQWLHTCFKLLWAFLTVVGVWS